MPGRRNYARERTAHARLAPDLERHYAALLTKHDQALIGRVAILAFLHRLGIRRLRGDRLTWRIVLQWRRLHGCPLLRGCRSRFNRTPALATTASLTAWILSRFATGDLFNVVNTEPFATSGSFRAWLREAA